MQNRATVCELGLHGRGVTEAHPDRNHRNPCRKAKPAQPAEQAGRERHPSRQGCEPEHPQGIEEAVSEAVAAPQTLQHPQ